MVFHDIWDQWFGIPKLQFQGPAAKKDDVVCEDDVASQSIMLGLPWADIDFILQAQQAWADRYARGRWYEHSVPFADGGEDKSNHDHDGGFSHFNARACFEADYERAIKWPAFQFQDVGWGTQDVHPMAQIPMDLIAGPWNEEKKRRLFWLTRGGIQLHLKMQNLIPWEVKVQCLDNAVISAECPDPLIINCLVSDWTFRDIPEDISRKQVLDLNRRIEWGGDPPDTKEVLRRIAIALNFDMQLPQWLHMPS
ncbi:hypothetical protein QQS21_002801 [Conoideocrella luteorostrata]|uniref:Uncharacterized protein n=1 Tax=Conoideocrella luteorostrata TaxID=1105319 RepID=A0AAJ0G0Z8_9HYPO|nr:hypothetical protein QQS21_002801 [Conoideocrella luteorostrata]